MLAWVHQSLASERELLVALFGDESRSGAADSESALADMPSTAELLDRVFESICKPLKVLRPYWRPLCADANVCWCRSQAIEKSRSHMALAACAAARPFTCPVRQAQPDELLRCTNCKFLLT